MGSVVVECADPVVGTALVTQGWMVGSDCPREDHDESMHITLKLGTGGVHNGLERDRRIFQLGVVLESVGHVSSAFRRQSCP